MFFLGGSWGKRESGGEGGKWSLNKVTKARKARHLSGSSLRGAKKKSGIGNWTNEKKNMASYEERGKETDRLGILLGRAPATVRSGILWAKAVEGKRTKYQGQKISTRTNGEVEIDKSSRQLGGRAPAVFTSTTNDWRKLKGRKRMSDSHSYG